MGNIAVFGGTFNPIHNEHVKMIKHISSLGFIDKVLVIPTHIPPHKDCNYLADDIHRINMCRVAIKGIDKAEVSDFEIKLQGKSYTYYTVSGLRKIYNQDKIYVVCGGDMAVTLDTWHRFDELKKLCAFLVIDRPGTDKKALKEYIASLSQQGAQIEYTYLETGDVSSTKIRENVAESKDIPAAVAEYIKENKLYGTQ